MAAHAELPLSPYGDSVRPHAGVLLAHPHEGMLDLVHYRNHADDPARARLLLAVGADSDRVWQAVRAEIARLLADHRLDHVTVQRTEEPPEQSPGGSGGY